MFDPESLTLIAITDHLRDGRDGLVARAAAAVRGGATMIQLRLKDVDARMQVEVARALRAALPAQDVARNDVLAAVAFDAEAFALGIAAVTCRAACFFLCHFRILE